MQNRKISISLMILIAIIGSIGIAAACAACPVAGSPVAGSPGGYRISTLIISGLIGIIVGFLIGMYYQKNKK